MYFDIYQVILALVD